MSKQVSGSAGLNRWALRWTRQGVLNVLLVCLMGGVVLAKQLLLRPARVLQNGGSSQGGSLYGDTVGVVDIYLQSQTPVPKMLVVQFPVEPGQTTTYDPYTGDTRTVTVEPTWFRSTAAPAGTEQQLYAQGGGVPAPPIVFDNFDFQFGTRYWYTEAVRTTTEVWHPRPAPDPPIYTVTVSYGIAAQFSAVPMQAPATDDQSVDARYDMRYSTWVHVNHKFGATTYRGGLFAGYNADNSSVGHAYVKFSLPALPAGATLWPVVGTVNAYSGRSYAPGSTAVSCQSVSASWTGSALTWETAPALAPQSAPAAQHATVTYDGTPSSQGWTHWEMGGDTSGLGLPSVLTGGGGAFAIGLGGANEPSTASDPIGGAATGWAYFNKLEAPGGHPPCVLYVYH